MWTFLDRDDEQLVNDARDGLKFSLTRREARNMQRQAAREHKRATKEPGVIGQWLRNSRNAREVSRNKPGPRGWNVPGGGHVNYVESPIEYQGTTVQVCGLWPFIAGSSNPVVGTPLGYHLKRGTIVCADPVMWFLSNLILNPSAFVLGRPGLGKSSLMRRMVAILAAWGVIPMVLSDTKPDYADLISAMGGQVIKMARGRGHRNPLDLGPMVASLRAIKDEDKRREALEEMRGRRLTTISGLLSLVLDRGLEAHESTILSETLRQLDPDFDNIQRVDDLREYIASRPTGLRALALAVDHDHEYDSRIRGLMDGLVALSANGQFGDLFSEHTDEHIEPGVPMCFDISGIDDADAKLGAAVQSVCWAHGSATVSAEKYLAEAEGRDQRHYLLIMDELWRMLKASEVMVHFLDALTRLNRQRGLAQIMCTHTMSDLKLSSAHLTEIAWGFVERSAQVFMGGLAEREMGNLQEVFAMTSAEKSMITDWSAEAMINPDTGTAAEPPGRGKFLLKIGKKPGVPFKTVLTSVEMSVNNTNKAWRMAA
ncbi:MAG: hypothetical protein ACTIID_03450 [Brevibacterium linens]|uniref:hypothetical protein n=1 Tax=Brevibacterium linens TaxID=1703 RepID=UPI003F9A8BF7